jgi:hypothetical protein
VNSLPFIRLLHPRPIILCLPQINNKSIILVLRYTTLSVTHAQHIQLIWLTKMTAFASTTEAALKACKTGNLPLLQSIAEPKGTALPDVSPSELASISTKLPPVYKMLKAAARRSQI